MRKYWAFLKGNIQNTLTFRGPLFVWLISGMLALLATTYVWLSASTGNQLIGGYTKNELITYYILVLALGWIVNWMPFYWLKDQIADGSIVTTTLIRPVSLYIQTFFCEAGWRVVAIWWGLLGTAIFAFIFREHFVLIQGTLLNYVYLIISIILATLVIFSISMVMAMLAFWFTHVDVFDSLYWIARILFGGQGIPITFLFGPLKFLALVFPFRYTVSFPLEIYFNKLNTQEIYLGFGIEIAWIIVFIVLYKIMLRQALRSYAAFGS